MCIAELLLLKPKFTLANVHIQKPAIFFSKTHIPILFVSFVVGINLKIVLVVEKSWSFSLMNYLIENTMTFFLSFTKL